MNTGAEQYHDFLKACLCDRSLAATMIASNPAVLSAISEHVGETVLHFLVLENEIDAVRWLIERGANVDTRNSAGQTPLLNAAVLGLTTMVEVLLATGANPNIADENGETPLHAAARSKANAAVIIEMLVAAGADVNARCTLPETPLHVAYNCENAPAIDALLKNGGDANAVDLAGERPGAPHPDENG